MVARVEGAEDAVRGQAERDESEQPRAERLRGQPAQRGVEAGRLGRVEPEGGDDDQDADQRDRDALGDEADLTGSLDNNTLLLIKQ